MVLADIPRRLSVHDKDFDFEQAKHWVIRLDGVEQRKVVSFDMDAGEMTRLVTDENGNPQLNESKDEVLTETVHGQVTVEIR